ncbi:PREDICTED: uncharacterized protein LOC109185201 [Ipomoea nil]|uniref:uncharacterized protein LOC109185201 n=1 Tax=Ipomoea nil TaxID=35883 RepID=UPI000900F1DD|nr:PREDICTED: uncharacterized protein LOC109185201 [Ipomoea nil]
MRNALPVRENLRRKHVFAGGGCLFCASDVESAVHLFCECPLAIQVWGHAITSNGRSLSAFVEEVFDLHDLSKEWHMLARFWTLWKVRNRGVNESSRARALVDENLVALWSETYSTTAHVDQLAASSTSTWLPPPFGRFKCNVDASLLGDRLGFGAIIRDHSGDFIAAYGGLLHCARDPYVAESMAVKEALAWLKERNVSHITIESDCLNFCKNYNSVSLDLSYVGLASFRAMS